VVRQIREARRSANVAGRVKQSRPIAVRLLAGALLATACAGGQASAPDPLAPLQQAAAKKAADWDALAKGLEVKLARMLPCDPRVRASIEDVSRASDARLSALGLYLQAAAEEAKTGLDRIQGLLSEQEFATKESAADKAEAEAERAAIEGQAADLSESVKQRASLGEARNKLAEIEAMVRERGTRSQQQEARRESLAAALRQVASTYEARQKALETEISALVIENSRWGEYYVARMARALMECAVTNPALANPRPPQRKKQ
jgi:hypothetical protein